MKKYSLWKLIHESIYIVMAEKERDTNSVNEVDKWIKQDFFNAASFYRKEESINADYVSFFNEN